MDDVRKNWKIKVKKTFFESQRFFHLQVKDYSFLYYRFSIYKSLLELSKVWQYVLSILCMKEILSENYKSLKCSSILQHKLIFKYDISQERPVCVTENWYLTLNQLFSRRKRRHAIITRGAFANYSTHSRLQFWHVLSGCEQADRQREGVARDENVYLKWLWNSCFPPISHI